MAATFPVTAAEREAAVDGAMRKYWELEHQLEVAMRQAAQWEPFKEAANLPVEARHVLAVLPQLSSQRDHAKAEADELLLQLRKTVEDEAKLTREDQDFWFRRFMVSLQIGNGAAFLAAVSALLHGTLKEASLMAVLIWAPLIYFGIGVAAAGLLPLGMAARQAFRRRPRVRKAAHLGVLFLTTASAGAFMLGIGSVAVEVTQLQQPAIAAARHQARIVVKP